MLIITANFLVLYSCYKGAITKRMTAIEEMAGMDVLCSDKTGTLTLNRLTVDRNLVEVQTLTPRALHSYYIVNYEQFFLTALF